MVIMVPAAGVIDALKSGAAAGARSATVFSAGFGEGFNTEAAALGRELAEVIAKTGLAVSGPNCMGNVCSKSRLVTLTEDRPLTVRPGPVALVGQSGGMMIYSNQALLERGIAPGYLITSGNEAGLSLADYIAFFAGEPEIKVIIIYIEAITDADQVQGRVPAGARQRQVGRRDQARPVGSRARRRAWRIPARSPAASRRSTRSRARWA